ncbi:polysaccharide pyruvyl transferase family protein [Butyrivibrio sp. AC2005]|uniref:polysaccharide pyruvyl transferase family protein n=1 Tax=Butyrivibrio sp. AC2005 TaxID=1280672 RepID=UPI00040A60A9|nr:polysaccharide pyruvyl transferase family protein [Butyrivibrio sp. AC2005]
MPKIGILTVHCSSNFGASLQASALLKYLKDRGNEVEIINYRFRGFLDAHDYSIKEQLNIKQNIKKTVLYPWTHGRYAKFLQFERDFIYPQTECVYDACDFRDLEERYDVFLVGSDQVWNPNHIQYDKNFFFDNIHKGIKASFATSFGKSELSDRELNFINDCLPNINYCSVREKSGWNIIKNTNPLLDVEVLADPVFLLDANYWKNIEKRILVPQNYVLFYFVGDYDLNLCKYLVNDFRKKRLNIVFLKSIFTGWMGDVNIYDAGPLEFLYLIDHASFVITNSFHGSAYSIIFDRPFLTVESLGKNERLCCLFEDLNIPNVQIKSEMDFKDGLWKIDDNMLKIQKSDYIANNLEKVDGFLSQFGV